MDNNSSNNNDNNDTVARFLHSMIVEYLSIHGYQPMPHKFDSLENLSYNMINWYKDKQKELLTIIK